MLPQVFNLGMEWRYKTKINYPLAEVKVLLLISMHFPVEDYSHFTANWLLAVRLDYVNHEGT